MRILDRYLAGAVLGGTALTLAALLPLLGLFVLADELDAIGAAHYGLREALLATTLSLPRYTYQIFPIATLIGALIGLGTLASRSELVAMRAVGLSVAGIVRAALLGGLLLAVAAVLIGEVLAPLAERQGQALRRQALSTAAAPPADGFWAFENRTYVNIQNIEAPDRLRDLFIYEIDPERGTLVTTHAAGARYLEGRWMLDGIARSQVSAAGVQVERIDRLDWDSLLEPGLLRVVATDARLLPVWDLYRYIRFMAINGQDAGVQRVAFWSRVTHPLLTLSMIFIAIPILLGSARTLGLGWRLFAGILIGIVYYLLSRTFGFLSLLLGLSPVAAALAPLVLLLAAALLLLRRVG